MVDAHGDYARLAEVVSGLGLGEHLCVIYDTQEEQFAAALPYLRAGLERGEKCLYIVDENTAAAVLDALGKGGTDVDRYLRSGALTIANKDETYLQQGRFDPDWMISFMTQTAAEAGAAKFSGWRTLLAEMTWALEASNGTARLIEYESKLNRFFHDHAVRGICQYNRSRFSPELLLGVIRTHPLVVYGGMVCKNPYYVHPDEFLKPNEVAREVERLLHNILEWERTQQALRHSEDHLRLVIDTIPTMAWSVRPDGTVDFLNQRGMDYTGLSLEQYVQKPTGPIHPEDIPRVMEKWRAGMAVGEPYEIEMRLQRADGEYRWFLVRTIPLRDDRGNIVKWYGSSVDIEDRKRAEEIQAAQTVQAELRAEVSTAFARETELGGILQKCTEAMVRHLDAAFARIWTLKKNDNVLELRASAGMYTHLDGSHSRLLVGGLEIGRIAQGRKPLLTNEVIDDPLISDRAWAKREGIVALAGYPLLVEGRVVGVMAMFARRALTPANLDALASVADTLAQGIERKQAEEALRRSEAYLAAAQELSHTGSWALNVSSGELFWSQETYCIFGFDRAQTIASIEATFLPRIHPEDRPKVAEGLRAAAMQKGCFAVDYRIVLPDGSIRFIHDVVYPVISEAGDVVERYGVIMDVTERKRAEAELQRSRDQLRALAARVQNVREEERTRVAREIHDELGQALTAIKIDLSAVLGGRPTNGKKQSESILKLVDEAIQSVRRIATELRPVVLDELGLVAAVDWASEEFQARTGIKCRLDLPQDDVVNEPERATALFRIFQETLTNVARHANATQVYVRLAKEDGNLTLEVHDNGKGVSDVQLSAASSLGILGMRERALLLGGELSISGAAGMGTTVIARIPETHVAP